ncbi:MAG: homocysteine S-methyltransferase family protein [Candidatus Omnitrophota bacterium]
MSENRNQKIKNILKKRIMLLDGATGTELQKRGMPQGVCPEVWCGENPDLIKAVHNDYIAAGADIIYTCTFGANRFKLTQYKNAKNVQRINKQLARIAQKAAAGKAFVAGDIGPTGKFVEPFGPVLFEEMVEVFKEQVKGLISGGVDLFVIETMMDIQEARAALIAVKELTDAFTMVTMTYEKDGRTLNGTDPVTALITLQSLGADAVGCNCSAGPKQMMEWIKLVKPYATVPLIAKPNAGMPKLVNGKTVFEMQAKEFASFGPAFIKAGVNMMGGCCGTTPEHIKALGQKISRKKPVRQKRSGISALSSARKFILLEGKHELVQVGERINPTGKKLLQEELRQGKMNLVRQMAKDQEANGASVLDVNVGVSGIDEKKVMREAVKLLSINSSLPLVIDSSDVKAVENALRIYPGRALINSVSAEKVKTKKLLPIARKYGAMFILLPLTEKEIPETFLRRKQIINSILSQAKKFGFTASDIAVDGLVMTVSSHPRAAIETLKTVAWCTKKLKANTILGLSNISFGLPGRVLVNATYLEMLKKNGLSMVIINPQAKAEVFNKKAEAVLLGKDKDAAAYIAYYRKFHAQIIKFVDKDDKVLTPQQQIVRAVMEGNRDDIKLYVKQALSAGIAAGILVNEYMIPAINKVGELFDKKEYFLPQLIASAETMKKAFDCLEPYLKKDGKKSVKKTVVIMATVEGDIHDIGKNIVALMLKNHGFEVIDLGKDVTSARIIKEIKKHKTPIVGLSALMTTTMVNMKEVIAMAEKENLKCCFVVGGAVVTRSYAQSLGAEYAGDGVEAVRVAKQLIQ